MEYGRSSLVRTRAVPGRRVVYGGAVVGTLFALLVTLVVLEWPPLLRFDQAVVDAANSVVADTSWLSTVLTAITNLGGTVAVWVVMSAVVVWLLIRREYLLAAYAAVTGLGAAALISGVKALVGRARPLVDSPVSAETSLSFPSGHTLGSTVMCGVLLVVFLPATPARFRKLVVAAAVVFVVAIAATRVGLAVHYPSDVLAGFLLGTLWLMATTIAFGRWPVAGQAVGRSNFS